MAEFTNRCFNYAMLERGPVQLNIPRDMFYGDIEVKRTSLYYVFNYIPEGDVVIRLTFSHPPLPLPVL
jgi:thiamine pyrophosphate-dependent acetolactate synthase large subunit-like protein